MLLTDQNNNIQPINVVSCSLPQNTCTVVCCPSVMLSKPSTPAPGPLDVTSQDINTTSASSSNNSGQYVKYITVWQSRCVQTFFAVKQILGGKCHYLLCVYEIIQSCKNTHPRLIGDNWGMSPVVSVSFTVWAMNRHYKTHSAILSWRHRPRRRQEIVEKERVLCLARQLKRPTLLQTWPCEYRILLQLWAIGYHSAVLQFCVKTQRFAFPQLLSSVMASAVTKCSAPNI
jgi:hypothetical protein